MPARHQRSRRGVALAVTVLLGGCAAPPSDPVPTGALPSSALPADGPFSSAPPTSGGPSGAGSPARPFGSEPEVVLSATSVYGRHAAVRGKVDVRLANEGPAAVRVERLQVRHPLFEVLAPYERRSTLPPDGRARIIPVPFGAPRCGARSAEGAVVVVTVGTGPNGDQPTGVRDVVVPLVDVEPGLVRAQRLACATEAVTDAVTIALGPPWDQVEGEDGGPRSGRALRTALRLERVGPGPVVVTGIGGSVLVTVEPGMVPEPGAPLVVLPRGAADAAVEVVLRAARCDPHARIESKRSFTFPVSVSLDGAEPVAIPVEPDQSGRAALQALLDATCATTSG